MFGRIGISECEIGLPAGTPTEAYAVTRPLTAEYVGRVTQVPSNGPDSRTGIF
jgi:hypothetical protein